jgi:hypothetical protein
MQACPATNFAQIATARLTLFPVRVGRSRAEAPE